MLSINKESLPKDQAQLLYAQGKLFDVDLSIWRHVFLMKEAKTRGYFLDNSLSQLAGGLAQLPLLTWSFLDYLTTRKLDDQNLVELGSGNSTLWFSKKFRSVMSYETNSEWVEELSKYLPSNASLNLVDLERLEQADINLQKTDWLLIDFAGKRTKFIHSMLQKGVQPRHVILDNADWYRRGSGLLIESGYTEFPFFGFKSGQEWISCTSIFLLGTPDTLKEGIFHVPNNAKVMQNAWDQI